MRNLKSLLVKFSILVGLFLFFINKRYFAGNSYESIFTGISIGLVFLAPLLNWFTIRKLKLSGFNSEAECWKYSYIWQGLLIFSLLAYMGFEFSLGENRLIETFIQKLALVSWVFPLIVGLFLFLGFELTFKDLGKGHFAEPRRIAKSLGSWLSVGLLLCVLVTINYIGSKKNQTYDLSYLKSTSPSQSTNMLLSSLKEPIKIFAFFPKSSEVLPYIEEYFQKIKLNESLVEFKVVDKDLFPLEAEEMRAQKNGIIVLSKGKIKEKINIGLKIRQARKPLSKLDSQFQKSLLSLTTNNRVVYFTRGHGELSGEKKSKDPLTRISALESWFRNQNYKMKNLDLVSGLGEAVPDDATLLIIAGPKKPFIDQEVTSIKNYVNKGGKVFFLLDVENQERELKDIPEYPLRKYLSELGVIFHNKVLANEQNFLRGTKTKADHWFLFSNLFASHESVSKLAKNDEKIAMFLIRSGYFEISKKDDHSHDHSHDHSKHKGDISDGNEEWEVSETVRSLNNSFVDLDMNYSFSKETEKKKSYSIGFAAESKNGNSRILGLADASAVSDGVLRNTGNLLYLVNGIRWLVGSEQAAVMANSEEDIKIKHSQKEDALIFYGSIFFFPLLVLGLGAFINRRKSRVRES